MAKVASDNLHSRLVTFLKIALPLLALAILSTMFLFSHQIDPEDAIPYADVDVAERLRQPRMTDARYAGMTEDGATVNLQAAVARPEQAGGASARGLLGVVQTPDGGRVEIAAAVLAFDPQAKQIILSGGVELISSTGIVAQAEGFAISLDRTNVQSTGKVNASGALGQLTADNLHLTAPIDAQSNYLLVFNGHVRLIYQPQK